MICPGDMHLIPDPMGDFVATVAWVKEPSWPLDERFKAKPKLEIGLVAKGRIATFHLWTGDLELFESWRIRVG